MTATGLERARQALRRGNPAALLGERERVWLDVKRGVYRLDQPRGPEELAKDVAAFANTAAGGLLLVGFATREEHGEEIVDALKPVPRTLVDLDKHRQVIATRVMPALRDVSVEWIPCDDGVGVLVIDIPAQPRSSQLFAVPAPTGTAEVSKTAVGVPVRRGDGTSWLRPHEIQHFIGLGWANSGDSIDKLAAAFATIQAPRAEEPKHVVGGGEPGWRDAFQQTVDDLAGRGMTLGEPVSDVAPIGPGVAQHLRAPEDREGWVLCAQPKHRPVVVAEEIWQALRDVGSGSPDGDALGALGFPVVDVGAMPVVDRTTTTVPLSGGLWGRGRLLRGAGQYGSEWRWEPEPVPHTMMSPSTRNWTGAPTPPQLRVRVLAILPFADAEDLKITPDRLDVVLPKLKFSRLAGVTTNLSRRRGGTLPAAVWEMGTNGNASDRLSYVSKITAPDGELALSAEVMITLPPAARTSAAITCAEVRVESFDAWSSALAEPRPDLRWTTDDLAMYFVAAWETATELLPQLIRGDAPSRARWAGVPHVELWVSAGQRHDQPGTQLALTEVLDLEPFGPSGSHGQLSELFVSLPSAPGLDEETRRSRARATLLEMAHRYGFMQVRESSF